jgi:hypothetical protein
MSADGPRRPTELIELEPNHEDRMVGISNRAVRQGVRLTSLVMVAVIPFAIFDPRPALGGRG